MIFAVPPDQFAPAMYLGFLSCVELFSVAEVGLYRKPTSVFVDPIDVFDS